MSLATSVSTPTRKQVKSALFQIELSSPIRQVQNLPLSQSHGRTSPTTPPTLNSRNKVKLETM